MRVLVTAASKHGSTSEIAIAIATALHRAGHEVTIAYPRQVKRLDGFDAVVLGSAIYAGHWLEEAREFVTHHLVALADRPVWLFSSGPLGEASRQAADPIDLVAIRTQTSARDHRLFGGQLTRHNLGLGERAMVMALRVPEGDFRSWSEIDAWSHTIAAALDAEVGSAMIGVPLN